MLYMAVIKTDIEEIELPDGAPLQEICEKLGVPFGCTTGICGTCIINVDEGMDNLTDRTQEEMDMELEGNERLACQCKIKKDSITIRF